MNDRTRAGWKRAALGGAVLAVVTTGVVTAQARPSFTIKECAEASTLNSTIDDKKPGAAEKHRRVEQLTAICKQKIAADRANPSPTPQAAKLPPSVVHRPVTNPNPPPVRPRPVPVAPAPQAMGQAPAPRPAPAPPNGQTHTVNVLDLMNGLLGKRREPAPRPAASAPAPAPAPQRPLRPTAPAPAAPAAAPAPAPAAVPAPSAPVIPVGFTPPAMPAKSTAEQRNVFGIQLGEAFNMPACAPGVVNASNPHAFDSTAKTKQKGVAAGCVQAGPAVQTLAQRMADAEGKPIPQGVQFALVRLATDRCPDWLSGSCTLSVALKSGVALGVAFLTNEDAESDIVRHLASKYNGRPGSREPAACDAEAKAGAPATRRMGNDSSWKFADLSLSYWAVSGLNCGQGRVMVQTSTMVDLFARAMAGDDQPQM